MVTMRGWRSLLVLGLLAHGLDAAAQRVTNVTAEQQGQALVIGYALDADGPVEVQLFLSTDRGRTWEGPLANCTGDLGKGVKPGTDKRIRWEVLQDRELVSDGVQFKVVAKGAMADKPELNDSEPEWKKKLMAALAIKNKPWLNPKLTYGSVTDIDGNTYATIQIGTQEWMAENLRTTRYRDGTVIPNVTGNDAWTRLNSGAWCNYANNPAYDATYGKLYNWFAVADKRGLCPQGWHVPTDMEWTTLTDYLGGSPIADDKLKATTLWDAPNTSATNESGFSGLPGGGRDSNTGNFSSLGSYSSFWWSASEYDSESAWYRSLGDRYSYNKRVGFSVRCLRD